MFLESDNLILSYIPQGELSATAPGETEPSEKSESFIRVEVIVEILMMSVRIMMLVMI